jgi:hypothetical protein
LLAGRLNDDPVEAAQLELERESAAE